jgi:hypothetical protein
LKKKGRKGVREKGRDWSLSFPVIDHREIKGWDNFRVADFFISLSPFFPREWRREAVSDRCVVCVKQLRVMVGDCISAP